MGILSPIKKEIKLISWILKNKKKTINMEFKKKSILIVDCWIPEFDKDSGSRRMYKIIQSLVESNYKVFLVSDQHEYKYNDEYVHYYEELGVTVYRPYLKGIIPVTLNRFLREITSKIDDAILSRPDVFKKYYPILKNISPKVNIIYDMVDFHYIRNLREYELNNSIFALQQAEHYKTLEKENCELADITFVVSETDKILLKENNFKCKKICIVSNIHDSKEIDKNYKPFEKRKDLLFIGGFQHTPNIDAVNYLCDKVLPLILEKDPSIKLHIVGSNTPNKIKEKANKNIIIHGYAQYLDSYFNDCKVFVAPLRFGAGIKGKIGQSLEYNLPLVTTDIGAEGFNFDPYSELMIANNSIEISNNVLELYFNPEKWKNISIHSKTILEPFSYTKTKENILKSLATKLD